LKKKKLILYLSLIVFLCAGAYFIFSDYKKGLMRGERHSGLDNIITQELFDSIHVGLERYKNYYGNYPYYNGKYFIDSIKTFVAFPDVYVYADSINENGEFIIVRKPVGKKFNYKNISNTYLGIGNKDLKIIYKYLSDGSFMLYSVGENYLDEGGEGDDVLY